MHAIVRRCVVVAAVFAIAAPVLAAGSDGEAASPCCFTNPRYAGVCEVTPGEGETCSSILAYLNNLNSTGKTYCGSTTVRGGWSQVDCASQATPTSSNGCGAAPLAPAVNASMDVGRPSRS